MRPPIAVLAVVILTAGCMAPASLESGADSGAFATPDPFESIRETLSGVPCRVETVGPATSANLKEIGLVTFDPSRHEMLDARGDHLLASRDQLGGLEVVDIRDPAHPEILSTLEDFAPEVLDVKWTPDGKAALLGNYTSIGVVDLTMPENPRLASVWDYPAPKQNTNMHMLAAKRINGADWVFVAPNDDTGVHILKLEGIGMNRTLTWAANFAPALNGGPLGPHDMTVLDDDILGKPLMYVANGFEGWLAADVSDPAHPVQLGGWVNADPFQSYTHSIVAETIGGRRIVATIAEVGVNALKVYDATDFQRPVLLAMWQANKTAPNHAEHSLQLLRGFLYMAHYHEGLYVFDLTTIGASPLLATATIAPMAHYSPPILAETNDEFQRTMGFKNVWDIVIERGILYVNDVARGVVVMGFGCLAPGDAQATSAS